MRILKLRAVKSLTQAGKWLNQDVNPGRLSRGFLLVTPVLCVFSRRSLKPLNFERQQAEYWCLELPTQHTHTHTEPSVQLRLSPAIGVTQAESLACVWSSVQGCFHPADQGEL